MGNTAQRKGTRRKLSRCTSKLACSKAPTKTSGQSARWSNLPEGPLLRMFEVMMGQQDGRSRVSEADLRIYQLLCGIPLVRHPAVAPLCFLMRAPFAFRSGRLSWCVKLGGHPQWKLSWVTRPLLSPAGASHRTLSQHFVSVPCLPHSQMHGYVCTHKAKHETLICRPPMQAGSDQTKPAATMNTCGAMMVGSNQSKELSNDGKLPLSSHACLLFGMQACTVLSSHRLHITTALHYPLHYAWHAYVAIHACAVNVLHDLAG